MQKAAKQNVESVGTRKVVRKVIPAKLRINAVNFALSWITSQNHLIVKRNGNNNRKKKMKTESNLDVSG